MEKECKKRKFRHLTWEKRLQIEALFKVGYKARQIADEIGCSFKTIYNELKRGEYDHIKVQDTFWYGKKYRHIKSYSPNKAQDLYVYTFCHTKKYLELVYGRIHHV